MRNLLFVALAASACITDPAEENQDEAGLVDETHTGHEITAELTTHQSEPPRDELVRLRPGETISLPTRRLGTTRVTLMNLGHQCGVAKIAVGRLAESVVVPVGSHTPLVVERRFGGKVIELTNDAAPTADHELCGPIQLAVSVD